MKYRIWSMEHKLWWQSRKKGYTTLKSAAGIYSEKEAIEIVKGANSHLRSDADRPDEAMIACDDLEARENGE